MKQKLITYSFYNLLYIRCLFFFIILVSSSLKIIAQEPSFSQFYFKENYYNPGFTGINPGLRCTFSHGRYLSEWGTKNKTTNIELDFYDTKFLNGGIGLSVTSLVNGKSLFRDNEIGLLYAKRLVISRNFMLQPGIKATYVNKKTDSYSNLNYFEYEPLIKPSLNDSLTLKNKNQSHFDYSAGIVARFNFFKNQKIIATNNVGVAFHHLTEPKEDWILNNTQKVTLKAIFQCNTTFKITLNDSLKRNILVSPGLMYEVRKYSKNWFSDDKSGNNDINIGVNTKFQIIKPIYTTIHTGIWYRNGVNRIQMLSSQTDFNRQNSKSLTVMLGFEKNSKDHKEHLRLTYSYENQFPDYKIENGFHEINIAVEINNLALPRSGRTWAYVQNPADRFFNLNGIPVQSYYSYNNTSNNNGSYTKVQEGKNNNYALLTATEINDFSKWKLWEDIKENELEKYQAIWEISSWHRYSVQLKNKSDRPVIDAKVVLKSTNDEVIWSAKTDNTGKAELWLNFFKHQKYTVKEIVVEYNNSEFTFANPHLFEEGINSYEIPIDCEKSNSIDIAFMVDATASMADEISFLKSDLIDIIEKTKQSFPDLTINLGSVFYRCLGNSYVTRLCPLTNKSNIVSNFINNQKADEGGDEVVEEAFIKAVDSLEWNQNSRARLLFFVLDEQPLVNTVVLNKLKIYIQKATLKGIRVIPIIASAENLANSKSLEYLMRSIALATNGTYVALTDNSNIGGTHAIPTTDEFDVELLNTLIKRIIYQYTYTPKCDGEIDTEGISDTTSFSNSPVIAHVIVDSMAVNNKIKTQSKDSLSLNSDSLINLKNDSINIKDISENKSDSIKQQETNTDSLDFKKIEIKFYPNPTNGKINIVIDGELDDLYLFDFSGKLISKINVKGTTNIEIDLSPYSIGIYLLKFNYKDKWYSGKILLRN